MRITILLLVGFLSVCSVSAQEREDDFKQVLNLMNNVILSQNTYPQEKAYMHFDNTGYFEGERMYFKCYVIRSDTGKPSNLSRVLYVDLVHPTGGVVKRRKLFLNSGVAYGDILLDSIFTTGFFEVRAYTRYMLNFGDAACFSRVFPIFNKPSVAGEYQNPQIDRFSYHQRLPDRFFTTDSIAMLDPVEQKKHQSRGYTVNVYPEGGKLVKGLYSRVAFTVSDPEHHPVAMAGEVVDADGKTLSIVLSDSAGRGIFDIIPPGGPLTMSLTTPDKKKIEFEMPDVLDEGLVLSVDPVPDDVYVRVLSTAGMKGTFIGMTLMNNGNIYMTDTISLSEGYRRKFSRDKLRPGVNQLTLFDTSGHIHAERLFFVCPTPSKSDTVTVTQTSLKLSPCGKVSLSLHSLPYASLSLSAMDYGTMVNGPYGNINTYMLLGSDIAGYIPHPEYYFEADDAVHRLAADSLMLFNGWRRYDWAVMSDTTSWRKHIQPMEDGLYVYGHLKPSRSKWIRKNPVDSVDMMLHVLNEAGRYAFGETCTDSVGYYAFRIPDDAYGDYKMLIVTKIEDKLKSYQVTIDRQFEPSARYIGTEEASPIVLPELSTRSEVDAASFKAMDRERMQMMQTGTGQYALSTATVKARKPSWKLRGNPSWDERDARRQANFYYDMFKVAEDYVDRGEIPPRFDKWLASVNHMLNGEHEGLVLGHDEAYYVTLYSYGNRPIIWMVNNQIHIITGGDFSTAPVPQSQINSLKGWEWEYIFNGYIDELRSMYVCVDQPKEDYAVVVYMFTNPYIPSWSTKGRRHTYFHGYDIPTKFETDDYGLIPPLADDFRRTLWWEPNILTDGEGNASVEFYNNSTCTQIYVSAEGMNHEGKLVFSR